MGVVTFCRYGLDCNVGDLDRCVDDRPQALLDRLSRGTGQSIRRLRNMTDACCHARTKVAARWVIHCDPEIVHKCGSDFPEPAGLWTTFRDSQAVILQVPERLSTNRAV